MIWLPFQLDQPNLGMPSREYYLKEAEHKDAYLRYMVSVAKRLGADDIKANHDMLEVLRFEEQLANVSSVPARDALLFASFTLRVGGEEVTPDRETGGILDTIQCTTQG